MMTWRYEMTANALLQTRIDPAIKDRASAVLEKMGLTVSDAVRMLLTRIATEGTLPFELVSNPEEHDRWFRAQVQKALEDPRPPVPNEEVERYFAEKRTAARRKAGGTP
jgi:DNA-damage-inducible protein J